MAFAESKHEQIRQWLLGLLRSGLTTAGGKNYQPDVVRGVREPELRHFIRAREQGWKHIVLVFNGDGEPTTGQSTGKVKKDCELGIVCARWWELERETTKTGDEDDPMVKDEARHLPAPSTIIDRMIKDVDDLLRVNEPTLGGLGIELKILDPNRHYYVHEWDAVHMPVVINYEHPRGAA